MAGKGIAAALLMANLQAQLRSQCMIALEEPAKLLRTVNELFYENTTDSAYATLFFGEYDDRSGRLRYVNCGHLAAFLLHSSRGAPVTYLPSTSTVLGLFKQWESPVAEATLSCGDVLALCTDGVTEAFNEASEEFGEERLLDSLNRHRSLPATDMVQATLSDIQHFGAGPQHDDITLIVAKCREK